jgi:hypothetical protein
MVTLNLWPFRRRDARPQSTAGAVPPSGDRVSATAVPERRQSPRRWGIPVEVFLGDDQPAAESPRGWIRNRSAGGLGLSTTQPRAEGTLLRVRVTTVPESVPWVAVIVKNCHPLGDRWMLGCQFAAPPPTDVVLTFR